ncbi:Protein farnesyltransferase/geranylgeranyltransferase type-1 subunit alpha [Trichoplax sp. H2]|nr:Protein farnesyltransferase/geranylgeranyltransferase type-1 subunit alpha [Trichoplax sp. H2]|eukprot:RDD38820.1 Protein farnesyltransferase/geranylgeranyltransferase type-1 subunit alpha [Trichoplax sp. H2]
MASFGDSSSSENVKESTLCRYNPEWADVTPIEQNDGSVSVVTIAYSEQFKDVFDYFRAVMKSQEVSERAFKLTSDAIAICPANYTVWQYRRRLLKELKKNLWDELEMIGNFIIEEPKNYQVWYHRRVLVEWLHDATQELSFTTEVLQDDPKNFHAWQHRQWCLNTFNLWNDNGHNELAYTSDRIKEDVRNNSAWNQRYYVINNTIGFNDDVLNNEISFTWHWISKAPNNESSWNYLRGVLNGRMKAYLHPNLKSGCTYLLSQGLESSHLLAFLFDLYEEELDDICDRLADEIDPIRKKYWKYMKRRLINKFDQSDSLN